MKQILVTKRDGEKELFDPDKIHKILFWATEDVSGVSVSQIETKSQLQLYPGIPTDEIHEIMIATAHELISEDTPNYQWVAARLRLFQLRKEALGQFDPWPLKKLIQRNIELKYYTPELFEWYSDADWEYLDTVIDHQRDFSHSFAGMEQFHGKYLVQNRVTKEVYETPQYLNMLISAVMFHRYPAETRLKYVKEFYDALSLGDISLPTPIMAGMRTKVKQFSSCVLIECGDSLGSINATTTAIVDYISRKAGIGIEGGHIRAVDSEIRGGDTRHTGIQPFYRLFQAAVKSCSQGGVRGGAATLYAPLWHLEIENILTLRSNTRTEETAVRHMDYGIQFNGLMYERLIKGENITLFSPHEVTDMHEAFFNDQAKFRELYEMYERKTSITKKSIPAAELFALYHTQRKETGRIYKLNVDHANTHSSFLEAVAPVRMSNLCAEITLPTKPLEYPNDPNGEIALCTLAAANLGKLKTTADLEKPLELLVRALNELLDYQHYPVAAAENATLNRRPLGIGIFNLAYWLAKNGYKYSDNSAVAHWDEVMEAFQYYLIKASMTVAKERGAPCPKFNETKYSQGIMPIDTYKRDIDTEVVAPNLKMDWDWLRAQVKEHGMMNSTLSAGMPAETSAQIANGTNGFEPPRGFITVKGSGEGRLRQVVPGYPRLKNKYELAWDMPNTTGYLNLIAISQKYFDQTISANTWYNPQNFPGEEIPMSKMIQDDIYFYRIGGKTLYYCNTYDGQSDEILFDDDDDCTDGGCKL
jgi:ribonucleoside-diphosphate reductase alpha chain